MNVSWSSRPLRSVGNRTSSRGRITNLETAVLPPLVQLMEQIACIPSATWHQLRSILFKHFSLGRDAAAPSDLLIMALNRNLTYLLAAGVKEAQNNIGTDRQLLLTIGTSSFFTSSTARISLMRARFSLSSTVINTWSSSLKCSQLALPRFCSSWYHISRTHSDTSMLLLCQKQYNSA